ncbi:membrane integrity-associated transporter subunit PqiC [Candidatus Pantoea edessiphila]|uniref:ABC-type transport auxiliary lipoprotein component domain-containing protein n=1 Tax=Candidatus Pantoea edessiphila TaxID=2044610 RepID=A0A2P5SWZ2_9GAMM|nr:membrane integrity-associated transporter subunit PqiC [Candidatus Pantoea edessiphila]PPI86851.1 hypothetical protein CRV10_01190 [Candidatus Pantoea edessiphila]
MKKKVIILITMLLTSCNSSIQKTYYHLPLEINAKIFNKPLQHSTIWLQQILIPDYLSGSGLVYQTNDVEYVITNNNLWVNPLVQQLTQTMVCSLNKKLPEWFISDLPLFRTKKNRLNIVIKKFQGRYDGKAIISGEWILKYQNYFIKRDFNFILTQKKDGYDELVKTLALGWQKVSQQISEEVVKLNDNKLK